MDTQASRDLLERAEALRAMVRDASRRGLDQEEEAAVDELKEALRRLTAEADRASGASGWQRLESDE